MFFRAVLVCVTLASLVVCAVVQRLDGMLDSFPQYIPEPTPSRTMKTHSKERNNDDPPEWRYPSPAKARPVSSILAHRMNVKLS